MNDGYRASPHDIQMSAKGRVRRKPRSCWQPCDGRSYRRQPVASLLEPGDSLRVYVIGADGEARSRVYGDSVAFEPEEAVARYHTNAISTVEALQELIALAKEVREARHRGEE